MHLLLGFTYCRRLFTTEVSYTPNPYLQISCNLCIFGLTQLRFLHIWSPM